MTTPIERMKLRHKEEIRALQVSCKHEQKEVIDADFEKRTECSDCGKILKRERN